MKKIKKLFPENSENQNAWKCIRMIDTILQEPEVLQMKVSLNEEVSESN